MCAPEVIPDVDIISEARVGKDLFVDEKIPRHGSGQRCVRVMEQSRYCGFNHRHAIIGGSSGQGPAEMPGAG